MKKIYLRIALTTFVCVTVQNIRWYLRCRRDGEIKDSSEIGIGLVTFQLLGLAFSLTWIVSVPAYVLTILKERRESKQQES